MTARHQQIEIPRPPRPREIVREAVEERTPASGSRSQSHSKLQEISSPIPISAMVEAQTRGLAEVCLVLLNTNEFMELE